MKRKNVLLNGMAIVLLLVASIACFLFFQDETEDHEEGSVEADFRCAENLVELGNALKRFADAHQGMLPDSLERLTELGYPVDSETCRCPARHLHYIYLGDRLSARSISPDTPIVFDRLPNHPGHLNVLYADFRVGRIDAGEKKNYSSLFRLNNMTRSEQERLEKRLLLLDKTVFQR